MLKKLFVILLLSMGRAAIAGESADACHPTIDPSHANYLIGYGSLINKNSRSQTNPDVKILLPVKVKGFIRDWNAAAFDYKIIYVGATRCSEKAGNCFLNGLAYLNTDMKATDARENIYCREEVPLKNIQTYKKSDRLDEKAKYWIYVTMPASVSHPNVQTPIMQSYVDIFIGGCIEQSANIANKKMSELTYPDDYGFAIDCIKGTKGWTTDFWLNDRVYPQRPWGMNPETAQIDPLLASSYKEKLIPGKTPYMNLPLEK